MSARQVENSESLKCGSVKTAYNWYSKAGVVARCSGLRRKFEKCELICLDGRKPRGTTGTVDN